MITLYILHAGITHPSPYFYNFCKTLEKYNDFNYIINPNLPITYPKGKSIIYFNRLKRFYDSNNINTAKQFLKEIKALKQMGWKIVWTIHNFFPIDRDITEVDDYIVKEFLKLCDIVFTLSNYMQKSIKLHYNVNAINHGMGTNILDSTFNNDLVEINVSLKNSFVFTFIGNIYKYKQLDYLIKSFRKLDNCYLIIAGKEPKNSKVNINKLINNCNNIIRYDGFIGDEDWNKIESVTNVFINLYDIDFPSFKYGFFPSNCIKIYNSGIPCISPDSEIIKELIPKKQLILFDPKNDNLSEIMLEVLNNKEKYKKISTIDLNKYSWNNVLKIFTNAVKGVFDNGKDAI